MIGSVIGSFKITEKIGEGGMGAVFKGIDTMLEREVAIKMLRPELSSQPEVVERFRSEAVTLAKLNHPNIATLYSFLRQGEDYFMVMEFVRGRTLDDVIRKFGAIDCNRAIVLFCQALEGIDHAHRMGIVHRDIKPANIMLTDAGSIKVMDFGIARVLGTARMTRQGNILGTVEYMAPEQVRGQAADARSDIYSLGILLYEMLTGRVPFESDSEFELMRAQVEDAPRPPRVLLPEIPLPVEQAIMRALAKKPDARPQTAGEMRNSLLSTMSAATPILTTAVPYAAPTTRVLEAPTGLGTGETGGKKTLVSDEYPLATQILGGASAPTSPVGDVPKATIAVHAGGVTGGGQRTAAVAPASTSLLARLNWKHFAAAAIVFVVLIAAAAFALRTMRGGDQPPQEEAASEEATPAPEASTPAPAEQTAAPAENPAAPNADAARVGGSPGDSNANVDRAARARANRNEQVTETPSAAGAPAAAAPAPAEAPQPPAASPPPPPDTSKKEPVVTATQNVNKNQPKDEKKGGFGGFFKKVFGGSDKKNDNKNKNHKK